MEQYREKLVAIHADLLLVAERAESMPELGIDFNKLLGKLEHLIKQLQD